MFRLTKSRAIVALVAFVCAVLLALGVSSTTQASPSVPGNTPRSNYQPRLISNFYTGNGITQVAYSLSRPGYLWDVIDFQADADVVSTNTIKIELQNSLDGVTWVTTARLWDALVTTTDMTSTWNYGYYSRLKVTPLLTTHPVTVVVQAMFK